MKSYLSTLAIAALGTGSMLAASSASKDGMQTTNAGYTTQSTGGGIANGELPMLAAGVQEFGLAGHLNWETETNYALNVSYGRFASDNWLLGARAGIDGQNSDAGYTLGVFAEYNFLTGTKWVPFIGIGADYNRLENNGDNLDSLRLGLDFGLKYFLRSNMAISASLGGAWNSDSFPEDDDFAKQLNFGLRYYF